ncbi:MAG: Peptidoglycan O-acetyltransferase [Firmicutes bacterium ADurb.BinA205]|nr:MAG: Peptidoglycan O-acetyltransferase [Firmicutes bacterium ADurb.BinA205]
MIYSSLLYIYGFLPLALLIFYAVPKKHREAVLLVLSGVFCASFSLYYLIFMAVYVLLNYTMCRITEYLKRKKSIAEVAMASTVILDITVLFSFRAPYMSWFAGMIRAPEGIYAVGISLFTLSAVGTLVDVYKGNEKAEKNIIRYALYIMFFPRLFIGPVMRYSTFRKAMAHPQTGAAQVGKGLAVFVKGLAKKVILADTLFMLYTAVYASDDTKVPAVSAILGAAAYLLGIYFEMSGLADMGAGTSLCFGYRFPECFRYPIFSKRINYYAMRWNTPVVMWFKRYILWPLTISAKSGFARGVVFLFAWALTGFWYTFDLSGVAAGIFLGAAILIENRLRSRNTLRITGVVYTLIISGMSALIFSQESLHGFFREIGSLIGMDGLADSSSLYMLKEYTLLLIAAAFFSSGISKKLAGKVKKLKAAEKLSLVIPAAVLVMLVLCTALMASGGRSDQLFIKL